LLVPETAALSSGNLSTLSHQQVSGCDALGRLTCCSQSTDCNFAALRSRYYP